MGEIVKSTMMLAVTWVALSNPIAAVIGGTVMLTALTADERVPLGETVKEAAFTSILAVYLFRKIF